MPMKSLIVALSLTLTALTGCASIQPVPSAATIADLQRQHDGERSKQVRSNMYTVVMGLEQYATDMNGAYPLPEKFLESLAPAGKNLLYLPDNQLPRSPWAAMGAHQTQVLTLPEDEPVLVPSSAPRAPSQVGTVLGPGRMPTDDHYDRLTYGALLYDFNPATGRYIVYAIGKQGDQAVVAGVFSNDDFNLPGQ